jgi:hypothetical protein
MELENEAIGWNLGVVSDSQKCNNRGDGCKKKKQSG